MCVRERMMYLNLFSSVVSDCVRSLFSLWHIPFCCLALVLLVRLNIGLIKINKFGYKFLAFRLDLYLHKILNAAAAATADYTYRMLINNDEKNRLKMRHLANSYE